MHEKNARRTLLSVFFWAHTVQTAPKHLWMWHCFQFGDHTLCFSDPLEKSLVIVLLVVGCVELGELSSLMVLLLF